MTFDKEIKTIINSKWTMRYCFMQIEALVEKTNERSELYYAIKAIMDKGLVTYRTGFIKIQQLLEQRVNATHASQTHIRANQQSQYVSMPEDKLSTHELRREAMMVLAAFEGTPILRIKLVAPSKMSSEICPDAVYQYLKRVIANETEELSMNADALRSARASRRNS